jgi:hypothetical protein
MVSSHMRTSMGRIGTVACGILFGSFFAAFPLSDSIADANQAKPPTQQPTETKKEDVSQTPANLINLNNPDRAPGRFLVFLRQNPTPVQQSSSDADSSDSRNTKPMDPSIVADSLAKQFRGKLGHIYTDPAVLGFTIEMSDDDAKQLAKSPRVDRVYAQLKVPYPVN